LCCATLKERETTALVRQHQVEPSVAIEIAERGSARAFVGQTETRCRLCERAVEIVAIQSERTTRKQKIQIAVVVQIREQRRPRSVHSSHAGLCCHVLKSAVATISQEVTASTCICRNNEEIEPPVIVDIRERRGCRVSWKGDTSAFGHVASEAALHEVESRDERRLLS
jgi:hypothetical protein